MRLHGLELLGCDVTRRVEFGDLAVKRRDCRAKLLGRRLTADRYRSGVIERVVVDSYGLPEPAVYECLLELRPWIIQDIGKDISSVGRVRILSDAWSLPLHEERHRTNRRFHDHSFALRERGNRRDRIRNERVSTAWPVSELTLRQRKYRRRIYIARNDQHRVVRDVVLPLNR